MALNLTPEAHRGATESSKSYRVAVFSPQELSSKTRSLCRNSHFPSRDEGLNHM